MSSPAQHLRHAALTAFAGGAIVVTWSELWFYRLGEVDLIVLWLIYSATAALCLSGLAAFGTRHRDGLILAAALFGFVIEGVPVTALYEAPPLSFVWTALAWHAAVSLGIGVYLFRHWMAQASWPRALAMNVLIGVGLGAWNVYSWTAVEVPGGQGPIFLWHLTEGFIDQFLLGYALLLIGHLVLDLVSQASETPLKVPRAGAYFGLFGGLTLAFYALGSLPTSLPWSLAFVPLAGLCVWGLWRHRARSGSDGVGQCLVLGPPIPLARYSFTLAIPIMAVLTVTTMTGHRIALEANALAIVIAGPVAVIFWIRALARSLRRPSPS